MINTRNWNVIEVVICLNAKGVPVLKSSGSSEKWHRGQHHPLVSGFTLCSSRKNIYDNFTGNWRAILPGPLGLRNQPKSSLLTMVHLSMICLNQCGWSYVCKTTPRTFNGKQLYGWNTTESWPICNHNVLSISPPLTISLRFDSKPCILFIIYIFLFVDIPCEQLFFSCLVLWNVFFLPLVRIFLITMKAACTTALRCGSLCALSL